MALALIHIHGQNDNQRFLSKSSHIELLDSFAENAALLSEYREYYAKYTELLRKLEEMESGDKEKNRLIEIYLFQIGEIDNLKLKEGD